MFVHEQELNLCTWARNISPAGHGNIACVSSVVEVPLESNLHLKRQAGPVFGRLDRLLPIGPRAEGGPALHQRKLKLSMEAVCVVPVWGPQYC